MYTPTDEMFVWPIVTLFAGNTLLYLFCQSPCGKRDNSWIDVMWSLSFCTPNAVILILRSNKFSSEVDPSGVAITYRMWLTSCLVFIWGLRLSSYIFIRHKSEDYRYKKMREDWEQGGTCVYLTKAYLYVFVGQAIFSLINNSAALYVNLYSDPVVDAEKFTATDIIGATIWALGFIIEIVSDK